MSNPPHRPPRILVAGVGNMFLGDDGFGIEVAAALQRSAVPEGVTVVDYGVRGIHLAYDLSAGTYDAAILVDAVGRGGAPGTLYVIDPEVESLDAAAEDADAHALTPVAVLAWVQRAGGTRTRILIVGCEPASTEEGMGLTEVVESRVGEAVQLVQSLVERVAA